MIRVFLQHTFLKSTSWQLKHLIWPSLRCGIWLMNPSTTSLLLTAPGLNWGGSGIIWNPKCYIFKLQWGELLLSVCCNQDLPAISRLVNCPLPLKHSQVPRAPSPAPYSWVLPSKCFKLTGRLWGLTELTLPYRAYLPAYRAYLPAVYWKGLESGC